MSRPRLQIVPHLDYTELTHYVETCQNPKIKNYWLAIQLLSHPTSPMTVEQVAEKLGYSTDWVRKLAGRYNRLGLNALLESRQSERRRIASASYAPRKQHYD